MAIVTLNKVESSIQDCPKDEIIGLMEDADNKHADFCELSGTLLKKLIKSFRKNGIDVNDFRETVPGRKPRPIKRPIKGGAAAHVASI